MSKTVPINILHLNSDGKRKSWNDQNFTNIFNHKLNFKTKPVGKNCNDSLMELFDGVGKKKERVFVTFLGRLWQWFLQFRFWKRRLLPPRLFPFQLETRYSICARQWWKWTAFPCPSTLPCNQSKSKSIRNRKFTSSSKQLVIAIVGYSSWWELDCIITCDW